MNGPNAVQFDGFSYLSAASLAGAADSKQVLGSLWFKASTGDTSYILDSSSTRAAVYFFSSAQYFLFRSTSGQDSFFGTRPQSQANNDAWHHLCFSTDGINAACFFDDVQYSPAAKLNNTLDLTAAAHTIGSALGGAAKYTGALAQLYLNYGAYMDLTVVTNRRKLVGPSAKSSIDMGSDGSLVTGSPPILFFDGDTSGWHINKGSGGGFTKNGALTTATILPPDYLPSQLGSSAILMGL